MTFTMAESSATSHHGQLDAGSLSRSMRNESGGSAGATDRPIETQPTETRVEGGADPASNRDQDAAPLSGPSSAPTPSSDRWSAAEIARSYEHCRSCVRTRARNFYYGLMLTPEPRRSALCAFYAWSRMADDLADGDAVGEPMTSSAHSPEFGAPGSPPDAGSRKAALNAFWSATLAAAGIGEATSQERAERDEPSAAAAMSHADLLWPAIAEVMRVYDLRPALLRPMCEGQLADLDRSSIPSF
ncbi:MAG: squalene/phytoene synthase family protein, partial [Planctomycetota bacterium]